MTVMIMTVACCAALLCGCESKKEDVKLKTESEAKEYVSKNLPEADYEKCESGSNEKTYYFKDKKCGFTFTVTSKAAGKDFDAVTVGYSEKTEDNWNKAYYEYLKDKVSDKAKELADANGFEYTWDEKIDSTVFLRIKTDKTLEDVTPALKELGSLIKSEDKHDKTSKHELWCYTGDKSDDYDKVFAFYLFEKDEVVDKTARDAYVGKSADSSKK